MSAIDTAEPQQVAQASRRNIVQGSTSNRLLSTVVVVVFLLLCSSAVYIPRYVNVNPDEARIVIELGKLRTNLFSDHDEADLLTASPEAFSESYFLIRRTHLGSEVQYNLLSKVTTVTIRTLRVLAALFFILTLAYIIWLSGAYALVSKAALLILLLLISTNGGIYHFGLWGVFDYSQRILQSVFLLHMLLFLQQRNLELSKRALALVLFGFCLFTIGYAALVLPIVMLVVVAFFCRRTREDDDARDPANAALKGGLLLLIPVLAVGLLTLTFAPHAEFLHPRLDIQHLFFPFSHYPKTAAGLLTFLFSATVSFLGDAFYTFAPIADSSTWPPSLHGTGGVLTVVVVLAFIIGLIGSLFKKTRDPTRFAIGAYVLSVLVSLAGVSVVGLYPFGEVRYALFVFVPLLVVAAYGIMDVGKWIGRLRFSSSLASRAQRVGAPILAGVVLLVSVGDAHAVISEKRRFNAQFTEVVELIETDRSPLLFYDMLAEWNLRVLGINEFPSKRKLLFDLRAVLGLRPYPYEEFLTFVDSPEDVLWITYHHTPQVEPLFAPYVATLETTHVRAHDLSIGPFWRVTRWTKDSSARVKSFLPLRLDIGHATARPWMRTGWQPDEISNGQEFAWSNGDRSVFTIPFPTGADIRMDFAVIPFVYPGSSPQHVTVVLNGTVVQDVQLQPGLRTYSVNLPATALRPSVDSLEFRYAYARVAREVLPNSLDERELAVAWFWINFVRLSRPLAPSRPMNPGRTDG